MKRLLVVLAIVAPVALSACAVGAPNPASHIGATSATLSANVFSNFGDTDYWWEYGKTTAYGSSTVHRTASIGQNELNKPHPVSAAVAGLSPDTTYHAKLCVHDHQYSSGGIVCNTDQTFTTHKVGPVASISAGFDQSCAILHNGSVRCWGVNFYGQLGQGNTDELGSWQGALLPDAVPPVDLGPGRTAVQISSGYDATCAVLDNHQLRCWGLGTGRIGPDFDTLPHGENIGDDETPGSVGPVDLGGGHTAKAVAVGTATCAILDDDSVKCWGGGNAGMLGYGNGTGEVLDPSKVGPVDLGAGRKAAQIDVAADHVCVILTTGDVMCWGGNTAGKLGYGYNETVNQNIGDDETPASVGTIDLGGHTALKVTGGDNHTCVLLDDHTVRCWGTPYRGINGDPTGHQWFAPPADPVDLGAGRTALDIEAAADHTCAVLDDHSVRCWGFGDDGRLGYGNTNDVGDDETPGAAGPVKLGAGRTATAVSAGRWHSCALLDNGDVRCWGLSNLLGYSSPASIGDDETPDTAGPVSLGD